MVYNNSVLVNRNNRPGNGRGKEMTEMTKFHLTPAQFDALMAYYAARAEQRAAADAEIARVLLR